MFFLIIAIILVGVGLSAVAVWRFLDLPIASKASCAKRTRAEEQGAGPDGE